MANINAFISSVKDSRKRTGVIYCNGLINPIINQLKIVIPEIGFIDCADFYTSSLTFSPKGLLDRIEYESNGKTTIVANMETFIVANSSGFNNEVATLLTSREPSKPIFFIFYSEKLFRSFKNIYESKSLNQHNIIEL